MKSPMMIKPMTPDFQYNHVFVFYFSEGRLLASSYNCKFIETSAALNHNVDELLAGLLSQIRLKQYGQFIRDEVTGNKKQRQRQKGLTGALRTALRGVFGKKQKVSGVENLYEI